MYVRYLKKQYNGKIPSGTNKGDLLREIRIRCAAERGDKACAVYAAAQDKGKPDSDGNYPSVPVKYAVHRCVAVLQYIGPMGQDLDAWGASGDVTKPGEGIFANLYGVRYETESLSTQSAPSTEYEVEKVVGRRLTRWGHLVAVEYEVKWVDYPPTHNLWMKASDIPLPIRQDYHANEKARQEAGGAAAACPGAAAAAPDPTTDGTHIPWGRHHHAMDVNLKFN